MYEIKFKKPALKFFEKLTNFDQEIIGKKIENLKTIPKLGKPLTGNLSGLWSLRVGKYRVLYEIKENILLIYVLNIGHRKNIYD
jgi:mRNA interferase RelE/StbE